MTKVLIFTTGGTIATSREEDGSVLVRLSGKELLDSLPGGVDDIGDVELHELALLPSTAITPSIAFEWASRVEDELTREDVAGAVVTLGTNAIEECSYLFDLRVASEKPIVLTGAMRMSGHFSPDGPLNLAASLRVVRDTQLKGAGAVVVMNDEIHAARDVVKTSRGVSAFSSPHNGMLGHVEDPGDNKGYRVLLDRKPLVREHIPARKLEARVGYVTAVLGCEGLPVDSVVDSGARGLVVEAPGGASTSTALGPAIVRAIDAGVVVAIASRVVGGGTSPIHTDIGESKWLLDRGALFAGTLSGPKARIKLMLALGQEEGGNISRFFGS